MKNKYYRYSYENEAGQKIYESLDGELLIQIDDSNISEYNFCTYENGKASRNLALMKNVVDVDIAKSGDIRVIYRR